MYLAKISIEGFRKLKKLEIDFRPGINIFVGPNNVGKTAAVDALRALLSTADEGSLRVDEYDLHDSKTVRANQIIFRYVFRGLTKDEEADFLLALKPVDAQGTFLPSRSLLPESYRIPKASTRGSYVFIATIWVIAAAISWGLLTPK